MLCPGGDDKAKKESKDFLCLMNIMFTTKVASVTLAARQKYGQKNPLSLLRDINKLSEYIAEELRSLDDSDHSYGNYTKGNQSGANQAYYIQQTQLW